MFLPFYDDNRLKGIRFQYLTLALIVANVVIWVFFSATGETGAYLSGFELSYGFIPSVVNDYAQLPAEYHVQPTAFSFVTYSFIHLDFWHLLGNMLFLWVFGDNVEDGFGHVRFVLFYMLCAAAAAGAHALTLPQSDSSLLGASGAVSGIVAAYLMLSPRVWIWVLVLGRFPLALPAWILLLVWIAYQFTMLALGDTDVSYGAHAGGILAGALLTLVLRRRGVPLFAPPAQSL
ncbi:rhomboid family intramembrane serine protease [Aureimonas sp. SA4125]|uniref:rhomboid family intramembrane serine protease n=1 Tax=Aureimonas sp. SA4125 TaxID=2826993 RepID=UPI001CC37B6A|nr:rhomboid family intramembrane serine protease [Aureimonas sp. SA4125]BDA86156.1 rhomboid family intramembrane serine protease [Aureimonas sp. SA4125]